MGAEIARCSHLVLGRILGSLLVVAPVVDLAAVSVAHRAAADAVECRLHRTRLDRTQPDCIRPDSPRTKQQKIPRLEEVSAPQEESRVLEIAMIYVSCDKHCNCCIKCEAERRKVSGTYVLLHFIVSDVNVSDPDCALTHYRDADCLAGRKSPGTEVLAGPGFDFARRCLQCGSCTPERPLIALHLPLPLWRLW